MQKKLFIAYMVIAALACVGMAASSAVGYRWFNTGSKVAKDNSAHTHGGRHGGHTVIFHK
jgi:hypothetical protein